MVVSSRSKRLLFIREAKAKAREEGGFNVLDVYFGDGTSSDQVGSLGHNGTDWVFDIDGGGSEWASGVLLKVL